MKNHWTDKIQLEKIAISIDDKVTDVFQNKGTLGDFFSKLSPEEWTFINSLKFTDGAMCQRGYEFVITGINTNMKPPYHEGSFAI